MVELVTCTNCGGRKERKYFNSTPITFKDETLMVNNHCGSCGHNHTTKCETTGEFCSYECFWEWAENNLPKTDKPLDERVNDLENNPMVSKWKAKQFKEAFGGNNNG